MKILALIFSAFLLFNCSSDNIEGADDDNLVSPGENPVGVWTGPLVIAGLIDAEAIMDIDSVDSAFTLNIFDYNNTTNDTLFYTTGTWTVDDTAIVLNGTECKKWDSQVNSVVSFACTDPVPVTIRITDNVWKIYLIELEDIVYEITGLVLTDAHKVLYFSLTRTQ